MLVDLKSITVDNGLPVDKRKKEFLEQIQNPHLFKVGEMKVEIAFSNQGISFQELTAEYFNRL